MGNFLAKATVQKNASLWVLGSVDPSFLSWMCLWTYTPDPEAQGENAAKEEAKAAGGDCASLPGHLGCPGCDQQNVS